MVASREVIDVAWGSLTAAVGRGDRAAALAAVPAASSVGLLQACGPAVLLALDHQVENATSAAETLAGALRARDFEGDSILADQIASANAELDTERRQLVIDVEDIATVMAGGGGWLDLSTGVAWPQEVIDLGDTDDVPDPDLDPKAGLWVPATESRVGWEDMADFIDTLDDQGAVENLRAAIEGRGAFSRFQKELNRHSQWRAAWRVFTSERHAGRVRAWLADEGYHAVPEDHRKDVLPE